MDLTLASNNKLSFQASTVDSQRLVSDSVRIFLEAVFDAAFQVPADARGTAVTVELKSKNKYPTWDADDIKNLKLATNTSGDIAFAAMRTETLVTSSMGEVIRGGFQGSLNNETLASAIETAAGVTAKKLVEHEVYCYFKAKAKST